MTPKNSHEQSAMQKIREEFQRLPMKAPAYVGRRWTLTPGESPELLAHALQYLCRDDADRARGGVFAQ